MTAPGLAERTARRLHMTLLGGTLLIGVVFVLLHAQAGGAAVDLAGVPLTVLRLVALALIVGGTLGLRIVRAALPPAPREADRAAWWTANGGRVLTLWVFPEGVGVMGAVLYYVSGDLLLLLLPFGWAVAMLAAYAPRRIQGE